MQLNDPKIQKEHDEEDRDKVDDMVFGSVRTGSDLMGPARVRQSSAFVENTAQQRGIMTDKEQFEQRIRDITGGMPSGDIDGRRARAPSVIQTERQERLRKKILKQQEDGVETRNTKYDDIARTQAENFLMFKNEADEEFTQNQLEKEAYMNQYREVIEKDDSQESI